MENNQVIWSHSRLNKLLENPAEYFLIYEEGIKPKQEKAAFSAGSAFHYALETNTSDLTEYYKEKTNSDEYTDEQCLVECMAECYLKNKAQIYNDLLYDEETDTHLEILEEFHELELTCEFPSKLFKTPHKFMGIIDLLLLTEKGWILIDYKTSSKAVDWDNYKSQLYKYHHLLNFNFDEFPVYKIAIINMKKTMIRKKTNENPQSYKDRIRTEYDLNEDKYIDVHVYKGSEFSPEQLKINSESLSEMMDCAQMILNNKLFFVHYSNIVGQYGPSQYYDIFYKTQDNHALYTIRDLIYDEDTNDIVTTRNCEPIDMTVLDEHNVLNKYNIFKDQVKLLKANGINDETKIFKSLKQKYKTDDNLLKKYMITYNKGY